MPVAPKRRTFMRAHSRRWALQGSSIAPVDIEPVDFDVRVAKF
jgi:hypothetical protein